MTGDAKYAAEYKKVAVDMKYAEQAARYLELRVEINYSDEELAMLSFYPFFRYDERSGNGTLQGARPMVGKTAGARRIRCGPTSIGVGRAGCEGRIWPARWRRWSGFRWI